MQDETDDTNTTDENAEKPTITIAEKQAGKTSDSDEEAKPTITIAEREGRE